MPLFTDVDTRFSSPGSPAGSFPGHDVDFNRASAPARASKQHAASGGSSTPPAPPSLRSSSFAGDLLDCPLHRAWNVVHIPAKAKSGRVVDALP
jgi:hypothetical protein